MSSPKMPKSPAIPPPPPTPPTTDQAQADVDQNDLLRRRRGRAADVLAPTTPSQPMQGGGAKPLLG